ncbi:MAG: MalM family protein [Rhodanobacter sp.]
MPRRFDRLARLAAASALVIVAGGCHVAKVLVPPNLRPAENTEAARKVAIEALRNAPPCCTSLADFSYRRTLPWQPQVFTLGPGSMVANLDGTHSYFLAFRLPVGSKLPYRIAVKSALNGRWLHSSYLFAPTMILLDSGFQPVLKQDIQLCEHMGWSSETTGAFGSLEVTQAQARYLLVYSSAAQQAGSTYWEQSPASFSSSATLQMGSTGSFNVPHGPDGTIWVGMMDKIYADAIDSAICKKPVTGDGVLKTLQGTLPAVPWGKRREAPVNPEQGQAAGASSAGMP